MMHQVAALAAPSAGRMANRMPAAVDTPRPPLNRKKTGHTLPIKTLSAASAMTSLPNPEDAPNRLSAQAATHTASPPLPASPANVSAAARRLPLRSTLVAPGFPEP